MMVANQFWVEVDSRRLGRSVINYMYRYLVFIEEQLEGELR